MINPEREKKKSNTGYGGSATKTSHTTRASNQGNHAMDKVSKSNQAKREERGKVVDINKGKDVGDEPTQATNRE